MRYLFLANTPAQVHLYKHLVAMLQEEGHEVLVLVRDYGCTLALAERYGFPFEVYGGCGTRVRSVVRNLPTHVARIGLHARRFDPDLVFGMGAYATVAGVATRTAPVLVRDSEPSKLDDIVSRPFAGVMLTPAAYREPLGENHYVFRGFKECAYLHPDRFSPSGGVREQLGLDPDERFAIVRLNAFGSSHDVGHGGFTSAQRRRLVTALSDHATVLVSDEGGDLSMSDLPARRFNLHPASIHDALAAADLLVADTQTMVTEAALLGTPAVRSNSFVGEDDMGNFLELERQGLVHNVERFDDVLDIATRLVETDGVQANWRRRDEYVADLVNLTDVLVEVATDVGALDRVDALSRDTAETDVPKRIVS